MKKQILFLASLLLASAAFSQSGHKIELNLQPSKSYKIYEITEQDITQTVMGNDQNIKTKMTAAMTFLVKQKKQDNYLIDLTIDSSSISVNSPYMSASYSSNNKNTEGDYYSKALSAMQDLVFEVTLSKYGKIVEFKGIEDMLDSLIKGFGLSSDMVIQLKTQMLQTFGDQALRGSLESITRIYPDHSVKTGESWTDNSSINAGLQLDFQNDWTLADYKNNQCTINEKSTIKSTNPDSVVQINGMPAKNNLQGTQNATFQLDSKTGWIISGQSNSSINGSISIQQTDQLPDGMDIPMKINTKTTYSSLQ